MPRRHHRPSPERSPRPAYDPDFDAPNEPVVGNLEPLPHRRAPWSVELLERLRAELRIVAPVLYVRLLTPEDEPPTLHTVRGRKDDRIEIDPDASSPYRWRSTGQEAGHPDHPRQAALTVAATMDAPVRTLP